MVQKTEGDDKVPRDNRHLSTCAAGYSGHCLPEEVISMSEDPNCFFLLPSKRASYAIRLMTRIMLNKRVIKSHPDVLLMEYYKFMK